MNAQNQTTQAHISTDNDDAAIAVEVFVMWDTNVLHVAHVPPAEVLGSSRTALVVARNGRSFLVVPPDAWAMVEMPGSAPQLFEQNTSRTAREIDLVFGARAKMQLAGSDLTFVVNAVSAPVRIGAGLLTSVESAAFKHVGLSFVGHASIAAALAFFVPQLGGDDPEAVQRDQVVSGR